MHWFRSEEALVGKFNVRTAREGYKRLELVTQFLESGMEILRIQEHRPDCPPAGKGDRLCIPWSMDSNNREGPEGQKS